jgi:hypothetical protein
MHLRSLLAALGLVLLAAARAAAIEVFGVGAGMEVNQVFVFDTATPGIFNGSGLNGLVTGDVLVGIEVRPASGGVLALAVGGGGVTRLYRIDMVTRTATPIAFSFPGTFGATTFGMDVDPVTDSVRIVNNLASDGPGGNSNSFRLDPDTGALLGVDPDLDFTGPGGGSAPEVAIAFSASGEAFGIVSGSDRLVRNGGAGSGFETLQDVGPLGVDTSAVAGFDIGGSPEQGFAVLDVGGATSLYTIDLATGAATLVGNVANGSFDLTGIALARAPTLLGAAELICERSPVVAAANAATPVVTPDAPEGTSDCGSLCTRWTSTCRSLVSVVKSCWQNAAKRVSSIRNADCNTLSDGAARSACKQAVKAEKKALKSFLAGELESGQELCDGDGLAECILHCS